MAKVGDTIFLDYWLHDFSTDKFVRATVKADGVEIGISPVILPHTGDGSYFFSNSSTLIFPPNTSELSISYMVYKDAGYTQRLKRYGVGRDSYILDGTDQTLIDDITNKFNSIIDIVTSHDLNSQLIGFVEETPVIVGEVVVDELVGFVMDDNTITGFVVEDDLLGDLIENDFLTGSI